jgi:hypothetical protein
LDVIAVFFLPSVPADGRSTAVSASRLTERGVLAFFLVFIVAFLDVLGYLRQVPFGAHFGFDNSA